MELVIFIGMQACGKSSFYKERFFDTHVRVNLDMLKTRHREKVLFDACLAAKQPAVIDNTSPTPQDRQRYIGPARAAGFRVVGYCFESDLDACRIRNDQRPADKVIPLPGLVRTHAKLTKPTLAEGFDQLYYVRIGEDGTFVVEERQDDGR